MPITARKITNDRPLAESLSTRSSASGVGPSGRARNNLTLAEATIRVDTLGGSASLKITWCIARNGRARWPKALGANTSDSSLWCCVTKTR